MSLGINKMTKGSKHNEITREKMRLSKVGIKLSLSHKANIGKALKKIGHIPPSAKGKKRSEEFRRKLSNRSRGEKCYFWKGGVTKINLIIRNSLEYKLWRESVFKRDNYTCVWCGDRQTKGHHVVLNADHIKPFALFPELRFAIDNGRTLCVYCHRKTDTYSIKKQKNVI